jgi:hypothetical protein
MEANTVQGGIMKKQNIPAKKVPGKKGKKGC